MHIARRHLSFASAVLLSLVIYYPPFKELMVTSFHDELYSYIPLMPILVGSFLYWKRGSIFSHVECSSRVGLICMGIGIILSIPGFARVLKINQNDALSLSILSAVLVWTGVFIWCYGFSTFKKAAFPFLLLLFIIPLPSSLTHVVVTLLQRCSVETVYWVLWVLRLPVIRDGYTFHFPKMSIKIAEQCAGIHSLLALLITSMIGAKLFLRKGWTRIIAVMAIMPITIVKNTLRIVVISLIVVYLGENAFVSAFHRLVGFSTFALLLLWPVIASLRRLETRAPKQN